MIDIKYIVLDASFGGTENGNVANGIVEKDFNLKIVNYIYDKLKEKDVNVYLIRDNDETITVAERINLIENNYGTSNDVIVISNRLNQDDTTGINIIYGLRNSSNLSDKLVNSFINNGFSIVDNYQKRDDINTSFDFEEIIRDTNNNETIVINYGNINNDYDINNIKNNWQAMADSVVEGIINYIGINLSNVLNYIVVAGDSLYSIARKYDTTVDGLKALNNLTTNSLSVGQILKVPNNNSSSNTYIVLPGDNLYLIAKKYGMTVDELKKLNNLTNNNLSIGQILKIS